MTEIEVRHIRFTMDLKRCSSDILIHVKFLEKKVQTEALKALNINFEILILDIQQKELHGNHQSVTMLFCQLVILECAMSRNVRSIPSKLCLPDMNPLSQKMKSVR